MAQTELAASYAEVNRIRTRYFDLGSGKPMLLWHGDEFGGLSSASTWNSNLPGLSNSFRVIAADRLGQGFTANPASEADYTVQAVLRHMYDFSRRLDLGKMVVVGQSRGAYFATRLVLEHPELATALIIVDTASLAPEVGNTQERMAKLLANPPTDPRDYARFRWTRLSCTADHITDGYLDEALAIANQPSRLAVRDRVKDLLHGTFIPSLLQQKEETLRWIEEGRIKVPTLVTWGANDPLAPLPAGHILFDMIAKTVPRSRMYVFNRSGHFPYREYPDEWNAVVTDFVRRNG